LRNAKELIFSHHEKTKFKELEGLNPSGKAFKAFDPRVKGLQKINGMVG
jgi:hypothetical protein